MTSRKSTPPLIRYRGGPLDGRAVAKLAPSTSPAYADGTGRGLTPAQGDFIVSGRTLRGVPAPDGVYRHGGYALVADGTKVHVYDWHAWKPAPAPASLDGAYRLVGSSTGTYAAECADVLDEMFDSLGIDLT